MDAGGIQTTITRMISDEQQGSIYKTAEVYNFSS